MHTRQIDNATFIFNPDLSGDVRIIVNGSEVLVSGSALREFIVDALLAAPDPGPQRGPASLAQATAQVKQREVG